MNPSLRINAFRYAVAGVLIAFSWVLAAPALALTQQELDWCLGKNATPDLRVNACTAAIQSGMLSKNDLAIVYQNRGLAYGAKREYDRAITEFDEAIRINPQFALPYNDRGFTYARKGDFERAIADFDAAIRLDPRYILALRNRGFAYYAKREYDLAIADYDAAIELDPNDIAAYNDRGNVYRAKGDPDRAIADFDKAIQLNPSLAVAYSNRCYAYYDKGDYDRAIVDCNEAIRIGPNSPLAYLNRGLAYFAKDDFERAIADYSHATQLDPKFAQAYFNRGVANLYSGTVLKAVADLSRANELSPTSGYVALWLDIADRRSSLPSRLAETARQIDVNKWPGQVIRLYLGQLTPAAVLTLTDDPSAKTKKSRVCQANFFIGELELQRGARDDAVRLFRSVVADCPRTLIEWFAAKAELNSVGVRP